MFSEDILEKLKVLKLNQTSWQDLRLAVFAEIIYADGHVESSEREAWSKSIKTLTYDVFRDADIRRTAIDLLLSILQELPKPLLDDFMSNLAWEMKGFTPAIPHEFKTITCIKNLCEELGIPPDSVIDNFIDISGYAINHTNSLAQERGNTSESLKKDIDNPPNIQIDQKEPQLIVFEQALEKFNSEKFILDKKYKNIYSTYESKCRSTDKKEMEDHELLIQETLQVITTEYSISPEAFKDKNNLNDIISLSSDNVLSNQGVFFFPSSTLPEKIYFVGDIHGDLTSLQNVLSITDFEKDSDVMLLFLGDYGDRGIKSLRSLFKLFELKVKFPNRIFLLRGNHEDLLLKGKKVCSATTDTEYSDLINQFLLLDPQGSDIPKMIYEIFNNLPEIILFEDGLMVTHGFIPPSTANDNEYKGTPTPEQIEKFNIASLQDLFRCDLKRQMRWQRFGGKEEVIFVWPDNYGEADYKDWSEFKTKLGISRMVRGHDHPKEGYLVYENAPDILTLCTSHSMDADGWQCSPAIAKYEAGKIPTPIYLQERNSN